MLQPHYLRGMDAQGDQRKSWLLRSRFQHLGLGIGFLNVDLLICKMRRSIPALRGCLQACSG